MFQIVRLDWWSREADRSYRFVVEAIALAEVAV